MRTNLVTAVTAAAACVLAFGAGRISAPRSSPSPHHSLPQVTHPQPAADNNTDHALQSLAARVRQLERGLATAIQSAGVAEASVHRRPDTETQPDIGADLVGELARAIRSLRTIDPPGHFGPVGRTPPPNVAAVEADATQFGESMARSPLRMASVGELLERYGRPTRGDLCQDGGYALRFEGASHTICATVRDGRVIDLDSHARN